MKEIGYLNLLDISINKYIILVDNIGLRARRASQILSREGYITLYVEGGYDLLMELIKDSNGKVNNSF